MIKSVCIMILTALPWVSHAAVRPADPRLEQAAQFDIHLSLSDEGEKAGSVRANSSMPVGAGVQPGQFDSRGALIAQTYRDWQAHINAGNMVAINPPRVPAGPAGVHFVFTWRSSSSTMNAWGYAAYDPFSGTFPFPGGERIVQNTGGTWTEIGQYPRVVVEPLTGKAIVSGQDNPDYNDSTLYQVQTAFDVAPMAGWFGDIAGGSIIPNATAFSGSWTANDNQVHVKSGMTVSGPDTILYIASRGRVPDADSNFAVKLFRKVGTANPGGVDPTWTLVLTDTSSNCTQEIATDPNSKRVALVWTKSGNGQRDGSLGHDVWYASSNDGTAGSWVKSNLTNLNLSSTAVPWTIVSCLYDSQGMLHILYPAGVNTDGNTWNSIRCKLWHWSQQDNQTHIVYDASFPMSATCGRIGYNVMNVGRTAIAECEGRLYVTWSANDPTLGPSDDCCRSQMFNFAGNAEVYMSVSKDLNGRSWDKPRNLSNSYTPACDTGTCADDQHASLTQHGMRDADFSGSENWTNAYTYDPSGYYSGEYYLQVFYNTDRYPGYGGAGTNGNPGNQGPNTLNDMRWIRLACVTPVIRADLTLTPSSIGFPEYTRPSVAKNYKIIIENTGNTDLIFSSITNVEDSTRGVQYSGVGWMSHSGTPPTLIEGGKDSMTLTLNAGGVISAGPTVLFGKLRFNYMVPAATKDLPIQFTVADTIVNTIWDTVMTSSTKLTIGTNGNMGHNFLGKVNMDYFGTPPECDTGGNSRGNSTIYLGDASPVIIRKPSPTTYRASWSIFQDGFDSPYGFKPMAGAGYAPHGSFTTSSYDGFNSGTFITSDSLVKVERTWWAPKNADSSNFIIERMRVFPANIWSSVTNLQIGEAFDFDVPTDSGTSNNIGGTYPAKRLVFQRGFNSADTVTDCADNSRRYAGAALLSWHMKNKTCYDSLYGGGVVANDMYVYPANGFVPDSVSRLMHVSGYYTEPRTTDLTSVLVYKDGTSGYTLPANDTLTIYTAIASVRTAANTAAGLDSLKRAIDKAKNFLTTNLGFCFCCADTIHPSAVNDLQAGSPTMTSITLTWTATGDDTTFGTADTCDIRYSTSPTFPANWNTTAVKAVGEPHPQLAGSHETFTVNGLAQHTTYYFAIQVADEAGNRSPISNVGSATTSATLVGYWKFDEGSGNYAYDNSGNNNRGQLINAPTWTTGYVGSSISFDGLNDFVEVLDANSLDLAGPFTISAWVYPKALPATNMSIVNKPVNYALQTDATRFGRVRVGFEDAGHLWHSIESPDSTLKLNKWQFIAGSWDGSNLRLYLNGKEIASGNIGGVIPLPSTSLLRIGAQDAASEFFNGYLDEVKVWGAGLYDTEIKREFQDLCCAGKTGDINFSGVTDLSDLSMLVSSLTGGTVELPCTKAANVNGTGIVDLSDLSALVNYLTGGGYFLPNCP